MFVIIIGLMALFQLQNIDKTKRDGTIIRMMSN
jgi:hypothetical protein